MNKAIHCHFRISKFEQEFPFYRDNKYDLEIYLPGEYVDDWQTSGVKEQITEIMESYNPSLTIHAPIYDFSPTSLDPVIRKLWMQRTLECFKVADFCHAKNIVFHSNYSDLHYSRVKQKWVERTAAFWREAAKEVPENVKIAIENIYDSGPELLAQVIDEVNHPQVGHCFDIGHYAVWGNRVSVEEWLKHFDGKIFELHLHDNMGDIDSHLGMGQGTIDFASLFKALGTLKDDPEYCIEGMKPEDNVICLEYLRKHLK